MEPIDEDTNAQRIRSLQERLDHLRKQLVSLEQEYALVECELTSLQGSSRGSSGPRGRSRVEGQITTCKHSCAHHKALMDPAMWGNFPGELLQMVFARLPLHRIVSLRCLSREWCRTTQEPEFRRLCASATVASPNLTMFALVDDAPLRMGVVSIRLFDGNSQRWNVFEMALQPELYYDNILACDGGLVCFVSRMLNAEENPLVIVVLNPLTKEYKVLPALSSLNKGQPSMVQLVIDRDTKCYKVIVAENKVSRTGKVFGKVYNSATGEWSSTNSMSDLVFGHHFRFELEGDDELAHYLVDPCVYDCREAELHNSALDPAVEGCKAYALVKDHLFVLKCESPMQRYRPDVGGHVQLSRFVLTEYQGQKSRPHWVKLRVHVCTPLETSELMFPLSENFDMDLNACRGALMVTVINNEFRARKLARTWLYDLATYKWRELPAAPAAPEHSFNEAMCELHWDVVP